jgi:hypothetical protein
MPAPAGLPRCDKRITRPTLSVIGRASHNGLKETPLGMIPRRDVLDLISDH